MQTKILKKNKQVKDSEVSNLRQDVEVILKRVRSKGESALIDYSKSLDNYDGPIRIEAHHITNAKATLPKDIVEGLNFAIERVTEFAKAQREQISEFEREMIPGVFMGHRLIPVDSCGVYVPAGRYPCLTSAVMSLVPAKIAGVKRIVACSPPGRDAQINSAILYTMGAIGADEIYCLGGAHAIAAMAYGTESIKPVDLIVGPGNQYVTEAKRQVFGKVGIDFLAGPSECMVIADNSARADFIAADLLAQCEHDPNARGALVTVSEELGHKVLAEIENQLNSLNTEDVARRSWENNGIVVVVPSLKDAAEYSNDYAPEHLEVHIKDPNTILSLLRCYGSLFLGEKSAEVFADKVAGTNHILPTQGSARFTGGLWIGNFLKVITHQWVNDKGVQALAQHSIRQAEFEGMDAHRRAALIRLTNKL
jgi:histidinol dehydrogenase/sulfopropanediol 3-dehydrogenase